MTQKSSNPSPDSQKPTRSLPGVNRGHEGVSNAEIYGALALILMELKEINAKIDTTYDEGDPTQYDIEFPTLLKVDQDKHAPDLLHREDKNLSL